MRLNKSLTVDALPVALLPNSSPGLWFKQSTMQYNDAEYPKAASSSYIKANCFKCVM